MNHYGIHVDPNVAITGVFNMNNLEWVYEDAMEGIDLDWEDHKKECEQYKKEEFCDDYESCGEFNHLIGFIEDGKGFFNPDKEAEYSAIVRSGGTIQVIKSKWGIRCALCSPCYPGQGDGDTPGEFLAFSIPPDVVGECGDQSLKNRIFLIGEEGK